MPLLAAQWTREPQQVALVTVATTLPWLLFSLPSGALTDRFDRRTLLWRANVLQSLTMGLLLAVILHGVRSVAALIVATFVVGSAQTLVDLASQAILPAVIGEMPLGQANGRMQAGVRLTGNMLGPAAGAALMTAGLWIPFAVDAVTFLVSAVIIRSLPIRSGQLHIHETPRSLQSVGSEIKEGLRWLGQNLLLRQLCAALMIWSLVDTAVMAVLPLYALEKLQLESGHVGLLLAVAAVGGLLGSLAAGWALALWGHAVLICGCLIGVGAAYLCLAVLPTVAASVVALLLLGASSGLRVVTSTALRQEVIPPALLGRVSSAYRFVGFGTRPLGAAIGGAAASNFGLLAPMSVAAVAIFIAAALMGFYWPRGNGQTLSRHRPVKP